ncbi:hypothetical protein D3C80_1071220 [compost metagenome]
MRVKAVVITFAVVFQTHTASVIPITTGRHTDNVVRVTRNNKHKFRSRTVLQLWVIVESCLRYRVFGNHLANVEYVFLFFVGTFNAFLCGVIGNAETCALDSQTHSDRNAWNVMVNVSASADRGINAKTF